MSEDFTQNGANSVLRSLISAKEFAVFERTGRYNLGDAYLNTMIKDLVHHGFLSAQQHMRLKKRLSSCELNVHLDERPGATRRGPFVLIPGGLKDELEWPEIGHV